MTPETQIISPVAGSAELWEGVVQFLSLGGVMLWLIAALSLATVTLILWKAIRLARLGAFGSGRRIVRAIALWEGGAGAAALSGIEWRRSARGLVAVTAMRALLAGLPPARAEARVERVARTALTEARTGLRGLELAATVGPLLGLLGTVTGMIAAFQGLEAAGARADTAALAGGIWEALLTTAAGMGVAIPAMIALAAFDGAVERLRGAMEMDATRILDAEGTEGRMGAHRDARQSGVPEDMGTLAGPPQHRAAE